MRKNTKKRLFFDKIAFKREYWRKLNYYYYEELEKLIHFLIPEGKKVLEIGCGTGELLAAARPSFGIGIDFSSKMLLRAKSKFPQFHFIAGDAENLPLKGKFDYIIISDLIGHLYDIEEFFWKIRKISSPETRIIITYYNFLWEPFLKVAEYLGLKMKQYQQNWLSAPEIENLLYLTDWESIKSGSRFLIPWKSELSDFINTYISTLWPWKKLSLINWIVARPLNLEKKKAEKKEVSVSIVVPVRNEEGNVERAVKEIPQLGTRTEIIFVEGHSTDSTFAKLQEVQQKYPQKEIKIFQQTGKGKFDAVKLGFNRATGDILMILDGDLTVEPIELKKFYRAIVSQKGEFINGARLVYPMEKEAMRFFNMLGNKFFSFLFSWLLNHRFKDTLCGTKVLSKKHWEEMLKYQDYFGEFDPFGDFFLIFSASKLNLKIVEIPVHYKSRSYGDTNIRRWYHGWLLFKMSYFAMKKLKFF